MGHRMSSKARNSAYKRIAARDGAKCAVCGEREGFTYRKAGINSACDQHGPHQIVHRCTTLELEHVVPLRMGGTNDDANLQLLCIPCHKVKSAAERRELMSA